jgi:hypothetical protein
MNKISISEEWRTSIQAISADLGQMSHQINNPCSEWATVFEKTLN